MTIFPKDDLPADSISWDLKKPCADCPFRRDAPDHVGICQSIVEYIEQLEKRSFAHTCHKTDNRAACDGPRNHEGPVQHCAGALHFAIRSGNDLQRAFLRAIDAGKVDVADVVKRAKADETVFATVEELAAYYFAALGRIIKARNLDPLVCCVFPEHYSDPPSLIKLSRARAEGLDILECQTCGEPASISDPYWPSYTDRNFCYEHAGEGLDREIRGLQELAGDTRLSLHR